MEGNPASAGSGTFDAYGFVVPSQGAEEDDDEEMFHAYSPPPGGDGLRQSWKAVCDDWKKHEKNSPQKLRRLLRKGIPLDLRSQVWQLFLNSGALRSQSTFNYTDRLSQLHSELEARSLTSQATEDNIRALNTLLDRRTGGWEGAGQEEKGEGTDGGSEGVEWEKNARQVMLDIVRTFPNHRLFIGDTQTKRSLFHILMLYVQYNPTVGYCQGMGYVGGLLLMYMTEEEAFWALVSLLERPKYLSGYYDFSLSRIKTHADVYTLLLRDRFPQVARHLENLGIHPLMYVTSWFMCLFTTLPCWDTVLAICDLLLLEGINTIFRAALAIIEVCAPELQALDTIEKVLPFLQHTPSRLLTRKSFIRVLWHTTVHSWEIELYQDMVFRRADLQAKVASSGLTVDRLGAGSSRGTKRGAPANERELVSQPAKKRKAYDEGEATPSTSQSLVSRLISAITPGKPSVVQYTPVTLSSTQTREVPLSVNATPGSSRTNLTAKRNQSKLNNQSQEVFKTPSMRRGTQRRRLDSAGVALSSVPESPEVFEMKEFSSLRKSDTINSLDSVGSDFTDSAYISMIPAPHLTMNSALGSRSGGQKVRQRLETSGSPMRRSPRLARRSLQHHQTGHFPSSSIVSPWLQRPLQDHMQSTRHPADHHAFKIFTTPNPVRGHQKQHRSTPSSQPHSPAAMSPLISPEVELRHLRRRAGNRGSRGGSIIA